MSATKTLCVNLQDVLTQQAGTMEQPVRRAAPIIVLAIAVAQHRRIFQINFTWVVLNIYFLNRIVVIVERELMIRLIHRHLAQRTTFVLTYQRKMEFLESLLTVNLYHHLQLALTVV